MPRDTSSAVKVPPLKIQGIKTKAIPHIRESVDWDGNGRWIEPFAGSCVVPLNLKPDRAVIGDTNIHIINFYRAVERGNVSSASVRAHLEFEGEILRHEGYRHYRLVRERFNEAGDPHDFLFLNRSCFNGMMRFNLKGNFNTPFCKKPERFRPAYVTKICNQVQAMTDAMEGRRWDFYRTDWNATLDRARAGDFVYCDPPYEGRSSDYFNPWREYDARNLECRLKALPCKFIYSMWSQNRHRRNDHLHDTFSGYEIRTFSHFYHLGAKSDRRNGMTEALVLG